MEECALYTVVALDPGVTTGYAIGEIDAEFGEMKVLSGQEKWDHVGLHKFLNQYDPDFLIYERFEFRRKNRPGVELYPRELIGIINLWWQLHDRDINHLYGQMPSVIGGFFSDAQLKRDSLYKEGRDHANDAMRHLLNWFRFGAGYKYWKKGYVSWA